MPFLQVCMPVLCEVVFIVRVCVFVSTADRSSNTDRTQAVPMRLCMLTAAGREEEQLLMGFQYKEPAQPPLYFFIPL